MGYDGNNASGQLFWHARSRFIPLWHSLTLVSLCAAAQSRETTSPTRKDHEAEAAGANSTARVPPRARTLVKGLVAGKYKKGKLLGAGVYGEVHLGAQPVFAITR